MFAAFLLALVVIAVHGSHLANSGSDFVAKAAGGIATLAETVTVQATSLRERAGIFLSATIIYVDATLGIAPRMTLAGPSTSVPTTSAALPRIDRTRHRARGHQKLRPPTAVPPSDTLRPRPESAAPSRDALATFRDLLAPDAIVAGVIGLLLYVLFVILLVRKRGGLRALLRSQAA